MNQQLLVEEFLKMKMRTKPTEDLELLNSILITFGKELRPDSVCFYDDIGRFVFYDDKELIDLSTLLCWRCGFDGDFEKRYFGGRFKGDTGKEFFEWSKVKCREWGIPVSTFKTIKETREVAKRLTEEWYEKFETIEEVVAWFEGEEFCLK